jgi:glutamate transport system permease protein
MRLILVPQAVRTMLPAIVAQCVVALKDTALGFIIAYPELLRTGQLIYNGFFNIIPTAVVVAAMYVTMNLLLSRLAIWLERRQSRVRPVVGLDAAEAAPVRV